MAAGTGARRMLARLTSAGESAVASGRDHLTETLGGPARTRVILVLAAVLGLSSADVATVGASATELRHSLGISNTDIGLLVTVTSVVAAVTTLPFGVLADRVNRTRTLGAMVACWGAAMIWSATATSFGGLLLARLLLGVATAAAGPMLASLTGDYFPGSERGRVYGYILTGDLLGAGVGFAVTGDIATLSWRAAFVLLALPAFGLAAAMVRLPEPARGGRSPLPAEGAPAGRTAPADSSEHTDRSAPGDPPPDSAVTDAQRLARDKGITPDPRRVLTGDPRRLSLLGAVRYVLRVRSNLVLIIASACGYYFMAGVETFGTEFTREQYHLSQVLANLGLLIVGGGAVIGVLVGGRAGDALLRRGRLDGRILVPALAATGTVVLFIPAIFTRDLLAALPYLIAAAFCLSAQNPPIDAARLDIMPAALWGRAEAIRTLMRSLAQSLAPLLFGAMADHVFGGGRAGLQWTFAVMLVPLAASAGLLYYARRTYPIDVASAGSITPPGNAAPPRNATPPGSGDRGRGGVRLPTGRRTGPVSRPHPPPRPTPAQAGLGRSAAAFFSRGASGRV
jgi:predicted MFS family arabinose efflux permease